MSLRNLKNYVPAVARNKGIAYTDQIQLVPRSSAPSDSTLANGRIYHDSSDDNLYVRAGGAWVDLTATGGGGGVTGSLDDSYSIGRTVTVDEGAITLNDATAGAGLTLQINKTGAGSGNVLDLVGTAAFSGQMLSLSADAAITGNLTNIDCNLAIAANGIYLDNGATARTGTDFYDYADSTDAHTCFYVDGVGSGAAIGYYFHGSYNGSPGGYGFKVVLDNNDHLDAIPYYVSRGAGAREVPCFDIDMAHTDAGTDSHVFDIDITGILDSNVIDILFDTAASTGHAINIATSANLAGNAMRVTTAGVRTAPVLNIIGGGTDAGTDDHILLITQSAQLDSNMIQLTYDTAASTGDCIGITMGTNVGGLALAISGTGIRTDDLIKIDDNSTGNSHIFDINLTGIYTGNVIDITYGTAAVAGDMISLALGTGVAASALIITGTGARTDDMIKIDDDSTGNSHIFDINMTGIYTGNIIDINYGTAAVAGDMLNLTLGTGVAASAIVITGTGTRTDDIIKIDSDDDGSGLVFDINLTGASSGNCLDITYATAANTGHVISITTGTNVAGNALLITTAGARTSPVIYVNGVATDAGTDDHIFYVNQTGQLDSNIIQLTYGTAASTGDAVAVAMGTNVAGRALSITGAGVRTGDVIDYTSNNTGAGMFMDINLSGAGSGNVFDLTFSTAAYTGNAVDLNMGTNVAGMAISIGSAATGTDAEGSALDVAHTGNLIAGANLVQVISTGNHDATSDVVYFEQSTGAGTAGTNLLHLNASGANVEALYVEAGVTFLAVETATPGSGNGETIPCTSNVVHYDPNGGSRTGVIVQAGLRDGQQLTITNIADAAETVTMAASGTSNVAFGTGCVIARYQAVSLVWCAATSLWYQNIVV